MTDFRFILTAEQLRMARACLALSVDQARELTSVSADTIRRLERGEIGSTKVTNLMKLQEAYEARGVIFLVPTDSCPSGVRCPPQTAEPEISVV